MRSRLPVAVITTRFNLTGKHRGAYLGQPATGKRFRAWGLCVHRLRDGKIAEAWTAFDDPGQRVQLGLVPRLA